MRYWPLTAVLLAFWMGRETGAANDREAEFDTIRAKFIELKSETGRTRIAAGNLVVEDRLLKDQVAIRASGLDIRHDNKPGASLFLASDPKTGVLLLQDPRSRAKTNVNPSGVELHDQKGRWRISLHASVRETLMTLMDGEGRERIRMEQSPRPTEVRCNGEKANEGAALTSEGVRRSK